MNFLELANKRYSCRKFTDRKVERELLDQVIAAGIAAPTAVNTQTFRIWSMDTQAARENISRCTPFTFGAQSFLVVGYKKEGAWTREFDQRNFADVDASIVATHMMLEIFDLGLATTWVGHFDAPMLQKFYPQMEGYELIAMFPIGYAADEPTGRPSPKHFIRKSAEELVERL